MEVAGNVVDVDMTEELTCVVCYDPMLDDPVLRCQEWHAICAQCFEKVAETDDPPCCPQCRVPMSMNDMSRLHEKILNKLPKNACPNLGCGLKLTDTERLQTHAETVCQFRIITCPVLTCPEQLAAVHMRQHVESHQLPRPGYYGTPMALTVNMSPRARHESLRVTMSEEDGFTELRHFTLCLSVKQPVPPPNAKKVPKFVAYVCETGLKDDEESTMQFRMHIESDEGKLLRPAVTSRCLSPGAGHPPGIYFTPAGDDDESKYVKSVVFDIAIWKASDDDDTDADEEASYSGSYALDYDALELMTSDEEEEEEENDETDATMSPFQIGQGIAQAHVQRELVHYSSFFLYHKFRRQNVKMEDPNSSNIIFTFPFMNEQFTTS